MRGEDRLLYILLLLVASRAHHRQLKGLVHERQFLERTLEDVQVQQLQTRGWPQWCPRCQLSLEPPPELGCPPEYSRRRSVDRAAGGLAQRGVGKRGSMVDNAGGLSSGSSGGSGGSAGERLSPSAGACRGTRCVRPVVGEDAMRTDSPASARGGGSRDRVSEMRFPTNGSGRGILRRDGGVEERRASVATSGDSSSMGRRGVLARRYRTGARGLPVRALPRESSIGPTNLPEIGMMSGARRDSAIGETGSTRLRSGSVGSVLCSVRLNRPDCTSCGARPEEVVRS